MEWLTKERHIGKSPLARALGFFLIISVIVFIALQVRSLIFLERVESPYYSSFSSTPSQKVNLEPVTHAVTPNVVNKKAEPAQTQENQARLSHKEELAGIPRIALHPLNYSQYRQHHKNGKEMAELVTSLLMVELGKGEQYELLDRSHVSTLLSEKSLMLVNGTQNTNHATLEKLPVSDFTLVGSLFSSDKGKSYSLKLVRNSTGQILGASRFNYSMDTIEGSIQESLAFIEQLVVNAQTIINTEANKKIAFGHFIDISQNDSQINQGRDITERLIEKFANEKDYSVLSRTQIFPLVFEEYLRLLQYTDEYQDSIRQNTNYLVHGKYRVNHSNLRHPLSLYLYIDMVKHGRELIVLHAKNWDEAYEVINDAIVKFIPVFGKIISKNNIEESKDLFIQALKIRGMLYDKKILTGKEPPTKTDIESFASTYKSENLAPARKLIERSLELNPHNKFSKMALAMYLKTEGDTKASNKIIVEVLKSQESASAEIAYRLLGNQKYKLKSRISTQDFEPFVGADQAENIYRSLLDREYLKASGDRVNFNSNKKSDQVFNRSHTLSLNNLDVDTAIQIFETLRSAYYTPGTQVSFLKPRRFRSRESRNKRNWYQSTYQDKHNTEAIVHFDIASTMSNIHINDATTLPSVEFYSMAQQESDERRLSNLEIAVDGFSSSVYLDTSYLKAMVLLGHSLCRAEIGRCASGDMIHSWMVDNTKAANLKGRGGMYFNVTKDVETKDRLIFLAADAIDRVAEANLTEMFRYTLVQEEYFVKKSQEKLKILVSENGDSVPENDKEKVIHVYAKLIREHCTRLSKRNIELRYPQKYIGPVEDITTLAQQSSEAALLIKALLADIEADYPGVYPYLIVHTKGSTSFLSKEQDELVSRVVSGKIVPVEISEFMEIALNLFEARLGSRDIKTAQQYIQYFIDYYGINEDTAMDFAYLYHRVGDSVTSKRLLKEYGRKSFTISDFTLPHVDGDYVNKGFDNKGQLKFEHKNNQNIYIVYNTASAHSKGTTFYYEPGEIPVKWKLYSKKAGSHNGNKNPAKPELFAFGNGGRYTGKRTWTSPVLVKTSPGPDELSEAKAIQLEDSEIFTEVTALDESELNLPENTIERLFVKGYKFDINQKSAIKGFSNKPTIGPLQDSYFPASFSRTRKISVVKEKLFEKGYLTVSGLPVFDSQIPLYKQIDKDFPGYSEIDRRNLGKALKAAKKVAGAGYVEIYQNINNTWKPAPTLISEDAIVNRHFGLTTAIHDNYALICDYKDGLYSYKKIDRQWKLQQRIESRCKSVEMNKNWAIVGSNEKVFVYKNNDGLWVKTQTLIADDYLVKKDKRQRFTFFGKSLILLNDTIIIGNPGGGDGHHGEIYIFTLSNNTWSQSEVLLLNKTLQGSFSSIAANNDFIIIANSSAGERGTPTVLSGSVFVYARVNSHWKLKTHLVEKGRPRAAQFGLHLLLKKGQQTSLLIQSKKSVFRYDLSH